MLKISTPSGLVFKHSGCMGDTIYSLPVIKYLTKNHPATLFLSTQRLTKKDDGSPGGYNDDRINVIKPLLESQKFIKEVRKWHNEYIDYDLDQFRDLFDTPSNICCWHAQVFNIPTSVCDEKWLEVDPVPISDIVIAKTARYKNAEFPWRDIVKCYKDLISFVGFPHEHARFCKDFGEVNFIPTDNLLSLAQIIAGCKLFIGNQSCPYAIAEGLKVNTILEIYNPLPDCVFNRTNATYNISEIFLRIGSLVNSKKIKSL